MFFNNTCITVGDGLGIGPYSSDCDLDKSWNVSKNLVLTETGDASICGRDWKVWMESNTTRDRGSTISKWPSDDVLIQWSKELLGY